MTKAHLLLVDDDEAIGKLVGDFLKSEGYGLDWARSVFQAEGMIARRRPDLVILDRHLPDKDGLELCRGLRAQPETQGLPVLMLTGKTELAEKVSGLRTGADDYLGKPFKPLELLARIEALLRRTLGPGAAAAASQVAAGDLRLDLSARKAFAHDKEVELWPKEYELLTAFVERPGKVLQRAYLLERVWGYAEAADLNSKVVDVTVGHLRRKLGRAGRKITAVRGLGYRYDP